MSEATYHFPPEIEALIKAKREEITRHFKMGLIRNPKTGMPDSEMAAKILFEYELSIRRGAHIEGSDDRQIIVKCPNCQSDHRMRFDVKYYQCKCSPQTDRPTFIGRVV